MRAVVRWVAGTWNRFWFEEVDPTPFALTRIGVAAAGWVLWIGTLPLIRQYYSDQGEFPIAVARGWSAEYMARVGMPEAFGHFWVATLLFCLWGLALAALTLGWRTRLAAWANWVLAVWFFFRNPTFLNGGDEVFRLASLYLALGYSAIPVAGRALTWDRRQATRRGAVDGAAALIPAWPARMVQVQISIVYLVAGFWKVVAMPWYDGSALVYALDNPVFTRWGMPHTQWLQPLFVLLTVTVAWWEFLFPLLAASGRLRRWSLAFGVSLHGMILVLMNIGIFPFIMLGCYPAFLKGGEARALVARVRAWLGSDVQPNASRSADAPSAVVP